jgi:hypothetical protein
LLRRKGAPIRAFLPPGNVVPLRGTSGPDSGSVEVGVGQGAVGASVRAETGSRGASYPSGLLPLRSGRPASSGGVPGGIMSNCIKGTI